MHNTDFLIFHIDFRIGDVVNFKKKSILWLFSGPMDLLLHSTATLNILNEFANSGYKVNLLAARSGYMPPMNNNRIHSLILPLRFVPLISAFMFAVVMFIFFPVFIIISKPDFVILSPGSSIFGFLPELLVSKFKRVKFVMDIRTVPVEVVGFRGFVTRSLFSLSVLIAKKRFHGITALTDLMKTEICYNFNIDLDKVGVWTSGVSDSLFHPENHLSEGIDLKSKLGLTQKFVVFYHGIFTANRGLIETIKAIKLINDKYPSIVFFLLGAGPILNMQKALILEENLQQNVILHNPVSHIDVPGFISMCDVGIIPLPDHPYWNSQNPLKLLEYLAMEKVVILTNIPAHRAVIGESKCGYYISSINPSEIAKAMEAVYLNKVNLESWGKIGREIIGEKYTWRKVAADLETYLLNLD